MGLSVEDYLRGKEGYRVDGREVVGV